VISRVALDTGPLGRIASPRRNPEITAWLTRLLGAGVVVYLPEIVDYELRRNLVLERLARSLARLHQLKITQTYHPLTTAAMLRAAELWADARRHGLPTANPSALDGDVILAAQALQVGATVATENVSHLSRFVDARRWTEIT
jgi:predicted nucleic acid-binding protein